jgi:DNA-binding beta-propeller fold protein YncE
MARTLVVYCLGAVILVSVCFRSRAAEVILVAGGGEGRDRVPARQAKLRSPFGVDFDRAGNLYLVEMTGHRVCRVDARGVLTVIAGTGRKGDGGDGGPAVEAEFNGMHSLAVGPNGDVFVADTWNNRVRRIDTRTGLIHAYAGTGEKGFGGDGGPAAKARFGGVYCVALDPKGKRLYLADLDNRRVRAVDSRPAWSRPSRATATRACRRTAPRRPRPRWWTRGRWPRTRTATSTSWSEPATPCAQSMRGAGFARWRAPGRPGRRATAGTRVGPC